MRSIAKAAPPPAATIQRSLWHSPVPYLFGGLAAMLGLIAFALLILACSYWKVIRLMERENLDIEEAKPADDATTDSMPVIEEEKVLVIMAGDEKPTFLATPVSNNNNNTINNGKMPYEEANGGICEKIKGGTESAELAEKSKQENNQ